MLIKQLKLNLNFAGKLLVSHGMVILFIAAFLIMPGTASCNTAASSAEMEASEYQVKAVYLYKFLMFIEWPEDKIENSKDTIVIGILGKDPFGKSFDIVDGKVIKSRGKRLEIKRFGAFKKDKELDLSQCDLLFISSSEKKNFEKITKSLKSKPTLTVADSAGFVESGGMINLLVSSGKVYWEVNMTPLWWSNLRPHSQFLRIAKRIVEIPKIDKEKGRPKPDDTQP